MTAATAAASIIITTTTAKQQQLPVNDNKIKSIFFNQQLNGSHISNNCQRVRGGVGVEGRIVGVAVTVMSPEHNAAAGAALEY